MPGFVILSLGLIGVFDTRMVHPDRTVLVSGQQRSGERFIDEDFETEVTVPIDELRKNPNGVVAPLLESLRYGFDIL